MGESRDLDPHGAVLAECREQNERRSLIGAPTREARAGFVELMRRHEKQLACVATALPGRIFAVAALRAFILGLRSVSPRSFAYRSHDSVDDVARWVPREHLKRTGVLVHPTELATVLSDAWALAR